MIGAGEDASFRKHCKQFSAGWPVRGNLVPDAQLAALLRQHGVKTIRARDEAFRKFIGPVVRGPLM